MGEYWGATADPNYGYSPYSGQTRYGTHPSSQIPFTAPPGAGNPLTVEAVAVKIRNLHPEQMAALADQWQNTWSFMADIRQFVVQQSTVLQDEHWQSPAARDAFLRKGPGEALTYLDVWMDAAQNNVTALRHLVNVSLDARRDLDQLLVRYERELQDAQNVSFGENLGSFLTSGVSWNAARDEEIAEDQSEIRERYRREAQTLAQRYGDQFFDYIAVVSSGVGPPVQPMNAVLSQPAALPPAGIPGAQNTPAETGPSFVTEPVANQQGLNPPGLNPPGVTPPGLTPPGLTPPGLAPPGVTPPGLTPHGVIPPGSAPPPGRSLRRPAGPPSTSQPSTPTPLGPPAGRGIHRPGQPFPPPTPPTGRPGRRPTTPVPQQPGRPGPAGSQRPGSLPGPGTPGGRLGITPNAPGTPPSL